MKFSMMSYTMARQPEHFDLEAMLKLTRELDLAGIDFVSLHDTDPAVLRRMTDDYGIDVVAHTFVVALDNEAPAVVDAAVDEAKRGIEAAVILGAPVVMLPTPPRAGVDRAVVRERWIAGLKRVAPVAADAGVILTVENFPGRESPFVIADDVLQAVREVSGMKITYDCGNAASGEDPAQSFTQCAEHVVHAHFKDSIFRDTPADGFRATLDGRYFRPALIGEGDVDHAACLRAA